MSAWLDASFLARPEPVPAVEERAVSINYDGVKKSVGTDPTPRTRASNSSPSRRGKRSATGWTFGFLGTPHATPATAYRLGVTVLNGVRAKLTLARANADQLQALLRPITDAALDVIYQDPDRAPNEVAFRIGEVPVD